MLMNDPHNLLRDAGKQWSPYAYFNPRLDCIRVMLRDCSYFERRIDEIFTLIYDNHPAPKQSDVAGLVIKGVSAIFSQCNIDPNEAHTVAFILDELAKSYQPTGEHPQILEMIEMARNLELSVRFPTDELLCA